MLTLHLALCFFGLLAGAVVMTALYRGNHEPIWAAVLLVTTVLISLTGFALPSPPGTPTPDPARILGVIEIVLVAVAAIALFVYHLAHAWRAIYVLAVVLSVYFNAFVGVTQAFSKIGFLHALAPTGKEPPFLVAQLLTLALFVMFAVAGLRRFARRTTHVVS